MPDKRVASWQEDREAIAPSMNSDLSKNLLLVGKFFIQKYNIWDWKSCFGECKGKIEIFSHDKIKYHNKTDNNLADHNKVESVDCGSMMDDVADVTDLTEMQYHHNAICQWHLTKC